jgi:hypothetical protein
MMRRARWFALAALLLTAAVVVMWLGEGEPAPARRTPVEFPSFRGQEYQRARKRATLVLPSSTAARAPATLASEVGAPEEPPRRDPFLIALPVKPGAPVVVFEANALRHSRLGERFVACLRAKGADEFSAWERDTGIDPLKDIDRVAFVGDAVVVSGFFDRVRWDQLGVSPEPYGEAGRIYRSGDGFVGAWRDQLLVLSPDAGSARAAIDQLEGRALVPETGISEEMTYGEVYGVLPGVAALGLLGPEQGALASRLAAVASRIELHVDAMQDVAAVLRVRGEDAAGLSDLARSLGAALAVARVEAQSTNDQRLADLLENAEVQPAVGEFSLDLALPADRLETWFEGCGDRASTPSP